ncbi:MAG: hypothetical protein Q9227_007214 [Pyrenula ochraceoflavens]
MTVITPVGRACSKQLITRAHPSYSFGVSRVASSFHDISNTHNLAAKPSKPITSYFVSRLYATASTKTPASRPKAHTGRAKAAKPKTTKATASTRASSGKKAAPKKKALSKTKSKRKTKAKAKPKPKPKPKRRVLTEKQKATKAKKDANDRIKALKARALIKEEADSGSLHPMSAWLAVVRDTKGASGTQATELVKIAQQKYKNLTPEEREHYNQVANDINARRQASYRKWLQSLSPEQIRVANQARGSLRTLARKDGKGVKPSPLRDERLVKSPSSAFLYFTKDRHASGDFRGVAVSEAAKLVGREWKGLSQNQQKACNAKLSLRLANDSPAI